MKKQFVVVLVILALLMALTPVSSALAGKADTMVVLSVRNRTGATINLDLINAAGYHQYFNLIDGWSQIVVAQGVYDYYASLPCDKKIGTINMNVAKDLILLCKSGTQIQFVPPTGR